LQRRSLRTASTPQANARYSEKLILRNKSIIAVTCDTHTQILQVVSFTQTVHYRLRRYDPVEHRMYKASLPMHRPRTLRLLQQSVQLVVSHDINIRTAYPDTDFRHPAQMMFGMIVPCPCVHHLIDVNKYTNAHPEAEML
jgi:hypothetical protein